MGPRIGREDNGRGSRGTTGGGVAGARFPNRPYEGLVAQHITGDHKGRPYRGRMAGWGKGDGSPHPRGQREGESGGRAVPEPPLRGVGRTAYNGRPQGSPLQGKDGGVGEGGWVPASARTTGGGVGGGRFPNRPYEGLVAQHITGDHKGRPYRGRMAGWGKGDGSPHPRGQREGESGGRAVPEPPLRGVGRTAYNGRPQGSPLRKEWEGGTGDGSPHSRGQREGGKDMFTPIPRLHEGRL